MSAESKASRILIVAIYKSSGEQTGTDAAFRGKTLARRRVKELHVPGRVRGAASGRPILGPEQKRVH